MLVDVDVELLGVVRASSTWAWVVMGLNSKRTMCKIGMVVVVGGIGCW